MEFMDRTNIHESDDDSPPEDEGLEEDLAQIRGPDLPPDPEPQAVSTRLKLESPHMYERHSVKAHEDFKTMLEKCLTSEEHQIEIEDTYEEEADEMDLAFLQRYYTTTYIIKSDRFNRVLFSAMRQFLTEVKETQIPAHMNPTVILPSGECFSDALVTHHSDMSLAAIYFGNVQGGVYLSHWEVSDDHKDSHDRASDKFFANFEYDRRDMVVVKFRNREEKRRGEQGTINVDMHYQVIVTRDSIRRIVVNNAITNSYGCDRTAIHFEVNCPPVIKNGFFQDENRSKQFATPPYQRQTQIKRGVRNKMYSKDAAIADSPYFTIEFAKKVETPMIYAILSRLRSRCGVSVEFAHIPIVDCWVWQNEPYFTWDLGYDRRRPHAAPTSDRNKMYHDFLQATCPRNSLQPPHIQDENRRRRFIISYLLECLLSRGSVVKDQLCLQYEQWFRFLRIIQKQMKLSFDRCERALEKLVTMIDERKRLGSLHRTLIDIFEMLRKQDLDPSVTDSEKREGYQRVRKIIITPTRMIYVVPEMMMSNRVLRKYDEYGVNVLRVSFRDDNNGKMRDSTTSKDILERRVKDFLINGFYIAGTDFGYLGSSNSQMRDHGAYFMQKNAHWDLKDWRKKHPRDGAPPKDYMEQIYRVRRELGKFETVDSVPKLMARLGQCFTQSRESGVKLADEDVCTTYDAIGGNNSNGAEFTFSDGVGCISLSRAKQIAHDMRLGKGWPSCYQFRYRGMKGVLAVNPELDERGSWARAVGLFKVTKPNYGDAESWEVHFVFRDSQIKFRGARQDNVEIVKCSAPSPVSLNRPFINILDQVSELQGSVCHQRMCNRIEELLDRQLRSFATQMIDEHQCRNRLKELPRRVDIDCINEKAGFEVSSEPFFRSLIKAAVKYSVSKQLRKEQIQIPFEKGRTMLGVVDESNQLQYGQVFVRYTKTIRDKFPPPGAAKQVLTGKVLLTKNPCIVAGDVRMYEAVDVPQLHHLVDVIVFPKHGPRPHPDEMAGSDLDGDEYCVIWDKELFLERNEDPFDFAVPKRKDEDILTGLQGKMAEFYLAYMTQDAVGTISNAFLFQSDLYGINHKVCMQLAKKNCEAVDFTKSGMPPEPLSRDWTTDPDDKSDIPPEKAERVPDFHFGNDQPVYESRRLIGKLYREIKTIEDVLRISEDRDELEEVEVDELLRYEGWEKYQQKAMDELAKYNTLLRTVMDTYGIRTEAEILTGYILEMRNRISDKDQDDMSFYNTNQMIETRITGLFRRFREEFFEEFGGWRQALTKVEKPFADENNVCHYEVNNPTEDMKAKASAYYVVCYERAKESKEKKLSFAWLAYDVLKQIKQDQVATKNIVIAGNPLWVMIENHMKAYTEENQDSYNEFHEFCFGRSVDVSSAIEPLHKYCRRYEGLDKVLFIITEWGRAADLYTTNFKRAHLALLAILYYINAFSSIDGDALCIIDPIDINLKPEEVESDLLPQPDHVLVKFFEFLASRKFSRMKYLSYQMLGVQAVFLRGEWIPLHKAGLKTYYNLVFNLRFDELLLQSQKEVFAQAVIRECESFTIDLPEKVIESNVRLALIRKTGVEEVQLRRQQKSRVLVSARGTLEALDRLRKLVTVKPPPNSAVSGKEISAQLVNLVYEKIMGDRSLHR